LSNFPGFSLINGEARQTTSFFFIFRRLDQTPNVIAPDVSFSGSKLRALYFSPDDSELLAVGSEQCVVWQLARGSSFSLSGRGGQVLQAGFTADGERIVRTSADRTAGILGCTRRKSNFGIAAALTNDQAMLAAYASGDP
jgi:hypothetical protein